MYLRLMEAASQRHDVHPQLLHNDQEDARIAFGQSVSDCQVVNDRRHWRRATEIQLLRRQQDDNKCLLKQTVNHT